MSGDILMSKKATKIPCDLFFVKTTANYSSVKIYTIKYFQFKKDNALNILNSA